MFLMPAFFFTVVAAQMLNRPDHNLYNNFHIYYFSYEKKTNTLDAGTFLSQRFLEGAEIGVFKVVESFFTQNFTDSDCCLLCLSVLQFNFVGKLLGPRGNSLKRLQEDTLTKMSILGKGSMRDKEKVKTSLFALFIPLLFLHISPFCCTARCCMNAAWWTYLGSLRRNLVAFSEAEADLTTGRQEVQQRHYLCRRTTRPD